MKNQVLLCMMCVLTVFIFADSVQADINNGLVAYYPFNGNANDEIDSVNNGIVNGATLTEDRFGNADRAYYFDGIYDFDGFDNIEINNPIVTPKVYSFSVWFYYTIENPGGDMYILANGGQSTSSQGTALLIDDYGTNVNFCIGDESYDNFTGFRVSIEAYSENGWHGQWHHVAGVWDAENDIAFLYVDGVKYTEYHTWGESQFGEQLNMVFGMPNVVNGIDDKYGFQGVIDDIRIYDRVLSDEEIMELYNSQSMVEVIMDIKPSACDNPINYKSKGVLPVAILGTADLDVTKIDSVSIRLAGIAPLRSSIEDCADVLGCEYPGPDGYPDLLLKFDTQEIVEAIEEMDPPVEDEAVITLELAGSLTDGTPIIGQDLVWVKNKGKSKK